ncbi:MAG: toxin-antitoxin system HicB family antitoxin [Solirubrobacteraceae bacterium]|jgi:predicted HicB family RNase H-like nuclease
MPKNLHVRLPDDLHKAISAEARRLGVSLNVVITIALRQWQEQKADKP